MTQLRTVYVNGQFLAETDATVSIFDRGFLFADAVYEVCAVLDGRLLDFEAHMARLRRSLSELGIEFPLPEPRLLDIHDRLIELNHLTEGLIYLQVSRGTTDRTFTPSENLSPTVVAFTQDKQILENPAIRNGVKIISMPELRWGRRDIKTVQLLSAAMAKMQAQRQGADDAWLVENGHVNEGSSNNVWIVTQQGTLITPEVSHSLLSGITRGAIMRHAREAGLDVKEQNFSIADAQNAREAFSTSATTFVLPVVEIDGRPVGTGRPGPVSRTLLDAYVAEHRRKPAAVNS